MSTFIQKALLYLASVGIGFSVFALFYNALIATGQLPPDESQRALFDESFSRGTMYAWLAGSFSGLFYFWLQGKTKYVFLSLPILIPIGYCVINFT